jgi:hypothetical protein
MRKDHHLLEREIEKVRTLSLVDLRRGYAKHLKHVPPNCFGHDLLRRAIIYAIEEKLTGETLPRALDRELQRIGEASLRPAKHPEIGGAKTITMKPGTEFVRVWQGRVYKVVVVAEGFAWNGTTWASLSEVARAITGTRWNGPRFFGLRGTLPDPLGGNSTPANGERPKRKRPRVQQPRRNQTPGAPADATDQARDGDDER